MTVDAELRVNDLEAVGCAAPCAVLCRLERIPRCVERVCTLLPLVGIKGPVPVIVCDGTGKPREALEERWDETWHRASL